jgi:signal peptidase II
MLPAAGRSIFLVTGAVLSLDQTSKCMAIAWLRPNAPVDVIPFLSLRLGFNTGISFGMFATENNVFRLPLILLALLIIVVLAVVAQRSKPFDRHAMSAIIGGALGNLADRFFRGSVTDFIDVHAAGWHWPSFNFADVAITLGVVGLLWSLTKVQRQPESY